MERTHSRPTGRITGTRLLVGLLAASTVMFGGVLLSAAPAEAANIAGPRRSALERLEEGDAIRRRRLLRGGRFEIAPAVGFTLNDAFQRNVLFGANLGYHISDSFAIGATVFGSTSLQTGLADEVEQKRAERAEGFSSIQLMASGELVYTPLIGKFALFGRSVLNYDLHILVGGGFASLTGEVADLDDGSPMAVAGVGFRIFVSDWMAANIEVRDYIFSASLNSVANAEADGGNNAEEEISNNFAVTIGFGFYFPREPELTE